MTSMCWQITFISKKKNYVSISKKGHNPYLQNGYWTHAQWWDKMDVGSASLFFFIIYFGYFTKYKENFTNTHDDRCLYIRVSILALVAE